MLKCVILCIGRRVAGTACSQCPTCKYSFFVGSTRFAQELLLQEYVIKVLTLVRFCLSKSELLPSALLLLLLLLLLSWLLSLPSCFAFFLFFLLPELP